ncbi:MAG: tRNA 2-selenouridine(34) synthase MnmH [Chromatocurvus sp.]
MRPDTDDYRQLFLDDVPLMDTRAPTEFARGTFPAAHSLPLMTDDERARVGTCYKQEGQAAAIALGHSLVQGSVKARRLAAWMAFAEAHPGGYLYCFRGGLRSQIVQQWMAEAGVHYPRIRGGYKAMRQYLLTELERCVAAARFVLVSGRTGSGKTRVIQALSRSVDLEGLANHRGSTFGALLSPQPSQIDFENRLAITLMKRLAGGDDLVILEDEGKLIGRLALPRCLLERMQDAPRYELEIPLGERATVVVEDYVVDLGQRYRDAYGEDGPGHHRERLQADLARARKRLGGERYRAVSSLMDAAFEQQQATGALDGHHAWITLLLRDYYDPMYDYQMRQRAGQRLMTGDREEVILALTRTPRTQTTPHR